MRRFREPGDEMGRNKELIRQWTMLRHLAAGKTNTINRLAEELAVTTRTIRRDLAALQEAGFPIYDDTVNGTKFWRLDQKAFGAMARGGLTLSELSALYFSRALLECFAGTHILTDLESALGKVESALSPQMKKFLDRLPRVIKAKPGQTKKADAQTYKMTSMLLEASLDNRVLQMRYHSRASGRDKDYVVHPHRLVQAQGGLYLIAFVPAYAEIRTFAVERIRRLSPQEKTFTPVSELESDPFGGSLGVHRGDTVRVQLRIHRAIASTVKERTWHPSQQFRDRPDGSVVMTLDVCDDYALRSWILGFGHLVRVLGPAPLVEWMLEEIDLAREQYAAGGPVHQSDSEGQPVLPFLFNRLASA
jgi:predicted DNA-binding transcriptional regulator YafY